MKAPWIFARLADPHLSDEIKTATILSLFQAPPEQLDGLFSARLVSYFRKIKVDPLELLKSQWTVFLGMWVWMVIGTVTHIEYTHGRNRAGSHRRELWSNFVAKMLNRETSRFLEQLADLLQRSRSRSAKPSPPPPRQRRSD